MPLLPRAGSRKTASGSLTVLELAAMAISGRDMPGFGSWNWGLWKPWLLLRKALSPQENSKSPRNVSSQLVPIAGRLPLISQRVGLYLGGPQEHEKMFGEPHHPLPIH